jgi:soluble lytic murein transglycosylase-like protein
VSEALLPLEGGNRASGASAASAADAKGGAAGANKAKLAKAAREFQALFLLELMKPLTEGLSRGSMGDPELGSGDRELYSWFWGEGLARQLADAWPLPAMPGTEDGAAGAASARSGAGALPFPTAGAAFRPLAVRPTAAGATAPVRSTTGPAAKAAGTEAAPAVSPAVSPSASPEKAKGGSAVEALIERASSLFRLPANLVRAVVRVESSGQADSVSTKGAVGLMQVMPSTAKEMGVRDPSDPWENLYAGTKYLSQQIARFGNLSHALAAYNAGPGAVVEHQGVPPYPETRAYVRRVLAEKARLDLSGRESA